MRKNELGHNPFVNQVCCNYKIPAFAMAMASCCHNPFVNQVCCNYLGYRYLGNGRCRSHNPFVNQVCCNCSSPFFNRFNGLLISFREPPRLFSLVFIGIGGIFLSR